MKGSQNSEGEENPTGFVTLWADVDSARGPRKRDDDTRARGSTLKRWPLFLRNEDGKAGAPSVLRIVIYVFFVFASVAVLLDVFYRIPVPPCDPARDYFPYKLTIDFAGRTIRNLTYHNTFVDFDVVARKDVFEYRLVKPGCPTNGLEGEREAISINPSSVYIEDGPILGFYEPLVPTLASLRYVNKKSIIYSPATRARVDNDLAEELANENFEIDYARLANDSNLSLSLIGDYGIEAYRNARTGKPFLVVAEVLEATPLGRAEWIKILGLLFEKSEEADSLFKQVVRRYNILKEMASTANERPSVFFNSPNTTHWSLPNGLQYISAYARDANADYKFASNGKEDTETLTFLEIRSEFQSAQVLLNVGQFPLSNSMTLDDFVRSFNGDARDLLKDLSAVRCANVWSNQKRISSDNMANDFYESGAYRADLVLEDYVQILHPSLNIKEDLTYMYSFGEGTPAVVGGACPITASDGDSSRMVRHH